MVDTLKVDLGFEYAQRLCQAIEAFTGDLEERDPGAFEYRGANLKYAVERDLYINFVNSLRLMHIFSEVESGRTPASVEATSELERSLALHLVGSVLSPSQIKVESSGDVPPRHLLRRIRSWAGRRALPQLQRIRPAPALPERESVTVLIHVIHQKFIRYLLTVTGRLSVPFAYLLVQRRGLEPFLTEQGLPFIDAMGLFRPPVMGREGAMLSHFPQITGLYDRLYASLEHIRPKCMVLVEGNAFHDEVANQVCKKLGIPTVCLQQGRSPFIHSGFRNMTFSKMLVWGQGFADLLQPFNPGQEFAVVGSHVVVDAQMSSLLPDTRDQKAICFFLQSPSQLIRHESFDELLDLAKAVAAEWKDVPILVREHPSFPLPGERRAELSNFPNVLLTPPGEYPVAEVLRASRLTVSIYSTTILESIAAGVLPLIFNVTSLPAYSPDVHAAGAGIEVKSLEAALHVVRRVLSDPTYLQGFGPAMKRLGDHYFYRDDREPVDRIVDEIMSMCLTPAQ